MPSQVIDKTSERPYFVTGTLGTSPVALGSPAADLTELVIQADPDNAASIVVGDAASQGWKLGPGAELRCPIRNPALLWGRAVSGTCTYSLFGRAE